MVAGLFGAILGSTHPIAAVLVCAFAGAITSGSIITFCIATLPNHVFGVSAQYFMLIVMIFKHAILKLSRQLQFVYFNSDTYSYEKL